MLTLPVTATCGPTVGMKMTSPEVRLDVMRLITTKQQVVQVEMGDGLIAADQLNIAQRTLRRRVRQTRIRR